MTLTVGTVLWAALWAVLSAAVTWLATSPLRRRTQTAVLVSLTLTSTAASAAAMLSAVYSAMSPRETVAKAVLLAAVAGTVTALAAAAVARRAVREASRLHEAVRDLAAGDLPTDEGPRLSGELEQLRQELSVAARRLAESRDRERALHASRQQLVASMSHDLRTPLAGIRAMAEALEDHVADDPDLYHKQIVVSVDRVVDMVDDLFALAAIKADDPQRRAETVAVDALVAEVADALTPLARAQDVAVTVRRPPWPVPVRGDGRELGRAVTNVLANAVRHTPAGGTVTVALWPDDGEVVVGVDDECGGIAPTDLPHLFEVGYRATEARTPGADVGAGLGLAITRGVVEAHGGRVEVVNTDVGCRVALRLPARA